MQHSAVILEVITALYATLWIKGFRATKVRSQ